MLTVAAPRPILKPCSSSQDSFHLGPPSPQPPQPRICTSNVQFSPCLSTTFFTHGKSDYNRCPITVTPNSCALTKRKYVVDELSKRPHPPCAMSPPSLVSDDGGTSSDDSEEYDSMPPTPTYSPPPTPSYTIPAHLLKSNINRARRSSSSYTPSSIPKSSPPRYCADDDARDDIFGGF